ncbi:tetratricopeptide repeat protein [Oceaniglobus ichthyenteri]|uniref:tetratricopeptide repeat protein n=1 Tax=Oceaniglobus ichthyenteri TaxID=2136177 RepID=UPI000D3C80AC|nr:tetratricopeptide repeat protein [Oceaniglobus ichthyenteri]
MRKTDAHIGWAAFGRPIICLALGMACATGPAIAQSQSWGAAPTAQAPRTPTDSDIIAMIEAGMADFHAGNTDAALQRFEAANDLTFSTNNLGLSAKHLPNLALARYYLKIEDWDEVARFAASVASALDVDGYRDHPYRIEAMAFQGAAAYANDRLNEADLLLRAAFAASAGRADLVVTQDLAHAYLAATAFQTNAPDAIDVLQAYLDAPTVEHSWIAPEMVAFLVYVRVFAAFRAGDDPGVLAQLYAEYLDASPDVAASDPQTQSYFRGFLGLLQGEAGTLEAARATLQERHDYLTRNDLIDDDYLKNIQRLAMIRNNMGDTVGAIEFLESNMNALRGRAGINPEGFVTFEQDLGIFQTNLGNIAQGQQHFRNAYEIIRRTRERYDSQVLALHSLLDQGDPGFATFAFADELRLVQTDITLDQDGTRVLGAFFAGQYLALDRVMIALAETSDAETSQYLLNRALYLGLGGYRDQALGDIAALRAAFGNAPPGIDPAVPLIVELIAAIWGPDPDQAEAARVFEALDAMRDPIRPDLRMVAESLRVYLAYIFDQNTAALQGIEGWLALPRPAAPTAWSLFAQAVALEAGMNISGPQTRAALRAEFERDIETAPDLTVLRAYGQLSIIGSAVESELGPDSLVRLNALRRQVRDGLPAYHSLVAYAEFALNNAHQRRGEIEQAIEWLDRATTTARLHPFPNADTIAFTLSDQARLLLGLGRTDQAALIAREAFDMIDPLTGRPNLVSAVITNYASTLRARTQDSNRVVEVFAQYVDDPAYLDRMTPVNQKDQLLAYADALVDAGGEWDKVRDLLDRAGRALDDVGHDLPYQRSGVAFFRAKAEYLYDIGDYGWAEMQFSNERMAQDIAQDATGTVQVDRTAEFQTRASWTASIGWDYAQTLPD